MAQEADDQRRLADAVERLAAAGFVVIGETRSQSFGDMSVAMHHGPWRIVLGRDRGQLFLSLSGGVDGGHDVELWESCLDQVLPSLHAREFEAEVAALVRRLPDLESLGVEDLARVSECLHSNGRWRFATRRQLGLIKPPPC